MWRDVVRRGMTCDVQKYARLSDPGKKPVIPFFLHFHRTSASGTSAVNRVCTRPEIGNEKLILTWPNTYIGCQG